MNLVFTGVQGSGKGTQAKIVSEKLGMPHISTGDLLRNSQGKLKKEIDSYISFGKLVPDSLMINVLNERVSGNDYLEGFILDGFPRNLKQAEELDKIVQINKMIEVHISDEEARRRIRGRWNCRKCEAIYNTFTLPKPKIERYCDKCNEPLYQRDDDSNDSFVNKRIEIYHKETEPVLAYYHSIRINGEQGIEKVTKDILKEI